MIALVTGGGSGIGRAVAEGLVDDGHAVAILGRHRERLLETTGARPDGDWLVLEADVTDAAAVDEAVAAIVDRYGRLDFLFNNAGTFGPTAPFEDYERSDWDAVLGVTLSGSFISAQAAYRVMLAQDPRGGRIVNNGSLSAHVPRPNAVAYTAAKHAVSGLTKAIALEGRAHGICCGQIDIGNATTEMTTGGAIVMEPRFDVRHVADAVRYMAGLPLDVNVLSLTVMASTMPYLGRG
jgi:NAD(P)-dependent dehydrogenase (short-subunit alcohol dehydrogenase family)